MFSAMAVRSCPVPAVSQPVPLQLLLLMLLLIGLASTSLLTTPAADHSSKRDASNVVHVEQGFLQGRPMKTVYGFPYVSYLGIPYAQPPVGPLRFKAPVPHTGWNDVRDASEEASPCPQYYQSQLLGNEDCLYLNVYVPETTIPKPPGASTSEQPSDTLPAPLLKVMVWIHGGGFIMGWGGPSMFGPDFIVERGVILVSLNYRLGALGFLSLETTEAPGNYGLKDQLLALQWVHRNIRAFGGDPDDVTLFGESAGAASAHLHIMTNRSSGLFKRAIANSGTALSPWAFSRTPRQRALSLAYSLGLPRGSTDRQLLAFLSRVPPLQLVNHTRAALSPEDRRGLCSFVFVPSVEPVHDGAFMTREPSVLLAQGRYAKVPYLTGISSAEANLLLSADEPGPLATLVGLQDFDHDFDAIIGLELRIHGRNNQQEAAKKIRRFFYGHDQITRANDLSTIKLLTDLYFQEGADYVVRKLSETSNHTVHYYRFSFKGPNSAAKDVPGVPHSEDLKYFFVDIRGSQNFDRHSEEGITRDRMVDLWTNFVKYGDPTPHTTPRLTTKWSPYTRTNPYFLDIDTNLTLGLRLDEQRMDFWHAILTL